MASLRIGIDFDNTIICYNGIFHKVALEKKLITQELSSNKMEVRNYLRKIGKEDEWTKLQGEVYGLHLKNAKPFPGVKEFFLYCKQQDISLYIISHKTRYPYIGPEYDLHKAAYNWLNFQGFSDSGKTEFSDKNIFFELTKSDKMKRILEMKCNYFIDDLPEFLCEKNFPSFTNRILFDPNNRHYDSSDYQRMTSWKDIKCNFYNII